MKSFLLKIGKEKYIEDMYQKEYLFFNTLRSFRGDNKDVSGRSDPREANILNTQLTYFETTTSKGTKIKHSEISKEFNGQYNEHPTEIPYNICSLYMLEVTEDLKIKRVDKKVLNLGSRSLLIYNLEKFYKSLDSSLTKLGIEYSRKPIIYYDHRTFDGKLNFHNKDKEFSYQNEYRILLQTPGTDTMKISIPGLKEFSTIGRNQNFEHH